MHKLSNDKEYIVAYIYHKYSHFESIELVVLNV